MQKSVHSELSAQIELPKLSVIIPVYNAAGKIEKCIASVLKQKFSDFELLLIDDGSTDNTAEICLLYAEKDKRVRYFKKENGGPFQARIVGFENSCGTYVTTCDADDYYANDKAFGIMYNSIVKSGCQALQFAFYRKFNHIKVGRRQVSAPLVIDNQDEFLEKEYPKLMCSFWDESHLTPSVWNKVYHRSLLKNLPVLEDTDKFFFGEDMLLNLFLLKDCTSFLLIPDKLYVYQENVGLNGSFSTRTMFDLDILKKYQLRFIEQQNHAKKDTILTNYFVEIVGWLLSYVQQGLSHIEEEELLELVRSILDLPRFKIASEYYQERSHIHWLPADLIRNRNPEEYIKSAREACRNSSLKNNIALFIRKIIYKI
ncbi:MAG: glycosyltransferase family 2 protein [Ruminococcaceae bacterium]|nr:glycosyltransferase family 2 protein [Oscillospiraceae bacterium]